MRIKDIEIEDVYANLGIFIFAFGTVNFIAALAHAIHSTGQFNLYITIGFLSFVIALIYILLLIYYYTTKQARNLKKS